MRQNALYIGLSLVLSAGYCSAKCPWVSDAERDAVLDRVASTDSRVKVKSRPSTDARFELVEVRPAAGCAGGSLAECLLPEIRFKGIPESAVRFGSDGLKPLDASLPSCGYLAVAEPRTRKGVVLGWISNVNGSGAFSVRRATDGTVVVTPILDYGPMPAGTSVAEPDVFVVGRFDDCRLGLETYADVVARQHGIRLSPNRSGYCTWCSDRYGYSDRSEFPNGAGCGTEASTLKCAELAARLLKPYGFDFIQFDDQWQRGAENNGPARDFSGTRTDGPYPNGFESVVRELNRREIAAGLWFIPFGGDAKDASWKGCESMYVKSAVTIEKDSNGNAWQGPVALARHKGDPLKTIWGGECLDMTCPAARDRLAETVRRMTYDWGFRYLKCDGIFTGFGCDLYGGYGWQDVHFRNAVFSDRTASNVQALRKGFQTIREAAAPGTFLLGCNLGTVRAMVPSFGLVDAMRIGNDNGPIDQFPERYLEGPCAGSMRYFLNGRVWWNDPDSTYVRASTPLGRARSMASWSALTDSLFEIGDWIGDLPEERLEILRRTLAHHGNRSVRPIDLFEKAIPNGWILDGGDAKVLGFFNWSTNRTLKIDWDFAYMGLDPQKAYVGYDFWEKKGVSPFSKRLTFGLPPDSCRILACREVSDGAVLISTSLHIASPVYGVRKGSVLTISGEPLEVRTFSCDRGFATRTIPAGSGGWVTFDESVFKQE